MPKPPNEFDESLYAEAEALLADNAEALRLAAILAYNHRGSRRDLAQLSFQWGRSAPRMAAAVTRWPSYFFPTDGQPPRIVEADEALLLFGLAALPELEANVILDEARSHSWRSWQVKARVEHLEALKAEAAGQIHRLTVKGCEVTAVSYTGRTVLITLPDELALTADLSESWEGRKVRILLVEEVA